MCTTDCPADLDEFLKEVSIDYWAIQDRLDLTEHDKKPTRKVMQILGQHILSKDTVLRDTISIEQVKYETRDHFIHFGEPTERGEFYQVSDVVNRPLFKSEFPNVLLYTQFYLMPYKVEYYRETYGVMQFLTELGGFLKAITIFCFILNYPIARHLFYLHILKQLFYARTKKDSILKRPDARNLSKNEWSRMKFLKQERVPTELMEDDNFMLEIKKHKLIKIPTKEKLLMFFHVYIPQCISKLFSWRKKESFLRLYNEGKQKIDRDLNVIRLVKNLNFLKIFMNNNLMSEKVRWQVAHCEKNTIRIDTDSPTSDGERESEDLEDLAQQDENFCKDRLKAYRRDKNRDTIHSRRIRFDMSNRDN